MRDFLSDYEKLQVLFIFLNYILNLHFSQNVLHVGCIIFA